ncbi:hypothetical protein [Butyrivibrio proteoclasticus]|uniref:hypothetical protein n=1 Tax=Butyrivibrio proteoclasticus TaxID=43305 RepID=UPI000684230F|nr:hypothetical protein [Butyrivibrio proteoclasticus]
MRKSNDSKNDFSNRTTKQGATFVVKVDYSQRGTWQGKVVWADENRTEHFRSALELIKLMDSAIVATNSQLNEENEGDASSGTA